MSEGVSETSARRKIADLKTEAGCLVVEDIVAVDIDDCVVDGELNAFAQEIVDKLGTYTELRASEELAVPYGTFGHKRYYERVHTYKF